MDPDQTQRKPYRPGIIESLPQDACGLTMRLLYIWGFLCQLEGEECTCCGSFQGWDEHEDVARGLGTLGDLDAAPTAVETAPPGKYTEEARLSSVT